jgi:hypothetical protein
VGERIFAWSVFLLVVIGAALPLAILAVRLVVAVVMMLWCFALGIPVPQDLWQFVIEDESRG